MPKGEILVTEAVEIFVLSYNRARYLKDCLKSILAQTFREFTVTVLDNASPEDIAGVVQSFQDDRLRLVINPSNIGFLGNWLKAYNMASAKYMMIFHDDDCMWPRLLECQLRLFNEHPHLTFVSTAANLVYSEAEMLSVPNNNDFAYELYDTPGDLLEAILGSRIFGFGSILYYTSAAKQIRMDTERFSSIADRPYMLELAALGPCARLTRPTHNARLHAKQDSEMRLWSHTNEIELCRYYLEVSRRSNRRSLEDSVIRLLVHLYSLRHPRIARSRWLKEVEGSGMLYGRVFLYLPYFLIRNLVRQGARLLAPKMLQRYVQCRAQRP